MNSNLYAQDSVEKPYHEGVIIFKIKPEYKYLTENKIDFKNIFENVVGKQSDLKLDKEFPNSQQPLTEKNKYGIKTVDISGIYRLSYNADAELETVIRDIKKLSYFEYVEPLYKTELLYVPDDPMNQSNQYWLNSIKAFEAWDIHKGDTNIVIGISDTGMELSHEDLVYQIKYNYNDMPDGIDNDLDGYVDNFRGWNFGENNSNVQADVNYHGAWVGGIAGASTDNGVGLSGAGFKCKILPIKIMNSDGIIENAYQSIVYAADYGCDVVNCSWGSTYFQQMAQDVCDYATINHDLLIVSAAGNTNADTKFFPSSYENVLSVAGTQMQDQKWSPDNSISSQGSSYSYYVDVCAPATNFHTTGAWGGYELVWGGTSFASPIVAGCAGILRSYFPEYNANQIAELIKISSDLIDTIPYNIPFAGKLGYGRVNLYNALTLTHTPSIVFQDFLVSELDGLVTVNGTFINYLTDAENLSINIELLSDYASIDNSEIYTGNLASMESYLSENEVRIVLDEDIPYDHKVILKFNYSAVDYEASQVIEIFVNPGYINVETDNLELSVAPVGRFGFSDSGSTIGDGFVLDNSFNLFYDCGIISGVSATDLYSSVRQSSDFRTLDYPIFIDGADVADFYIRTEFVDSNDVEPFGLRFIENVYAWSGDEYKDFIIVDFDIINESIYDLENFYFGMFTDWDLVDAAVNRVSINVAEDFMYAYSENSQSMYAGIKVISKQEVKNYALAQTEGGDGTIDISDGFADIEKFYMISNSNEGYSGDPTDVVAYSGVGPVNLASGDTITIGFAFIAAESLFYIDNALSKATEVYDELLHPQNIDDIENAEFVVYPNPVTDFVNIFPADGYENDYSVAIYNSLGEIVFGDVLSGEESINLMQLKAGIYMIKVTAGDKVIVKKFTKQS
jgi:hypothetical protein